MKLVLSRTQRKTAIMGKPVFILTVRAEISDEDRAAIKEYKLWDTMLYDKKPIIEPGEGALGIATRLAHRLLTMSVSVGDLTNGKTIECKDIVEMLAVEQQIREAAQTFYDVLRCAKNFGNNEVVDLAA